MRWTVEENGQTREMFSLHVDEDVVAEFIRRVYQAQIELRGAIRRPQGHGKLMPHVNGNLYHEVHQFRKKDILGVWKSPKDLGLE